MTVPPQHQCNCQRREGLHEKTCPRFDGNVNKCGLCGLPMSEDEQMFQCHGYSGPCPEAPVSATPKDRCPNGPKEPPYPRCKLTVGHTEPCDWSSAPAPILNFEKARERVLAQEVAGSERWAELECALFVFERLAVERGRQQEKAKADAILACLSHHLHCVTCAEDGCGSCGDCTAREFLPNEVSS